MDGLLIFDYSNDLIFMQLSQPLKTKVLELAKGQGLINETQHELSPNVIIQIFSPLITSQRIMLCQFDNSYSSIQCDNNFNIAFEEFLGFLFLQIGDKTVEYLQRTLGVCISFIRRICGPNVNLLKSDATRNLIFTQTLNQWRKLYGSDQTVLIEAIEQLLVSADVRSHSLNSLLAAAEKLKQDPYSQRSHVILFIGTKLLSLYSTRNVQILSSADLLFLSIFIQTLNKTTNDVYSCLLFFEGAQTCTNGGCIPCIVYVGKIFTDAMLITVVETGNLSIASGMFDAFFAANKIRNVQMQADLENLKEAFDTFDASVKQTIDGFKKAKHNAIEIDEAVKTFVIKWEGMRKRYLEFFKTNEKGLVIKIESALPKFRDSLKDLFNLVFIENTNVTNGRERITEICHLLSDKLAGFQDFLTVKADANFSMTSYLEEFPGLVHFIHVDRSAGRIIAPNVAQLADISANVTQKVWSMVELSRSYLNKGHLSMMWKDLAFNYTYFLWFEDMNGMPIKPKEIPNFTNNSVKPLYQVGILSGDYYQRLIETCFPKSNPNKIKCYELYCIHLGLVTATCVLEHFRRLAATISDVVGISRNPADLL